MIIMSNYHENLVLKTLQQQDTNNVNTTSQTQSIMHSSNSDFPIAVAVLAIMAVALLLASYYIFVIKCCLNWQTLDPLRRFSISRARGNDDDPLMTFSPMVNMHRGLDEWLINNLPAYQYKSEGCISLVSGNLSLRRCAVCLTEFQEQEILRVLPKCSHTFHLDCIDVWLMNNASCPLCRSSISGRTKYPIDQIIAPSSSPQELLSPFSPNLSVNFNDNEQDYLVIELGEDVNNNSSRRSVFTRDHFMSQRKTEHYYNNNDNIVTSFKKITRKSQRMSIMGDECINIRPKDEQFFVQQPIRRSISMDSAADRGLYLQVQEIIRRNNEIVSNNNEVSCTSVRDECNSGSSSNGRVIRKSSFFPFGHGRGSRSSSSILPINCNR